MRTSIQLAVLGLVALISSFLFTSFIFGIWSGISGKQSLFQESVSRALIENEIDRFRKDFYSGRTIPLYAKCLQEKEKDGAFDECKLEWPLLSSSINSTNDADLNEHNLIEVSFLFCFHKLLII